MSTVPSLAGVRINEKSLGFSNKIHVRAVAITLGLHNWIVVKTQQMIRIPNKIPRTPSSLMISNTASDRRASQNGQMKDVVILLTIYQRKRRNKGDGPIEEVNVFYE